MCCVLGHCTLSLQLQGNKHCCNSPATCALVLMFRPPLCFLPAQMQLSQKQTGTIRAHAASRKLCVRVRAADARTKGLTDPAVKLVNGAVTEGECHAGSEGVMQALAADWAAKQLVTCTGCPCSSTAQVLLKRPLTAVTRCWHTSSQASWSQLLSCTCRRPRPVCGGEWAEAAQPLCHRLRPPWHQLPGHEESL